MCNFYDKNLGMNLVLWLKFGLWEEYKLWVSEEMLLKIYVIKRGELVESLREMHREVYHYL